MVALTLEDLVRLLVLLFANPRRQNASNSDYKALGCLYWNLCTRTNVLPHSQCIIASVVFSAVGVTVPEVYCDLEIVR